MCRLALLIVIVLCALSSGQVYASELIVSGGTAPPSYDPAMAREPHVASVSSQLYSGLVRLDSRGRAMPDIAERWRSTRGGRAWVFKLRADARFSTGDPVTLDDVRYSLRRRNRTMGVASSGAAEIRIQLPVADAHLPRRLAHPSYGIVRSGSRSFLDPMRLSTSGPYRVQAFHRQRSLTLRLRDDHALSPGVAFQTVEIRYLKPSAALRQFRVGQLDAAPPGLSYPTRSRAVASRLDGHHRLDSAQVSYLYLNTQSQVFRGRSARQGLAQIIDQRELARAGRADGDVVLESIAPMSPPIPKARVLGEAPPMALQLGCMPGREQLAARLQAQLRSHGAQVQLRACTGNLDRMSSTLDAVVADFWPSVADRAEYWAQFGGGPESRLLGPGGAYIVIPLVRHRPGYLVNPRVRIRYNSLGITDYAAALPAQPPRSNTVEIPLGVGALARLDMRILAPDGPRLAAFDAYLGDSRGLRRFSSEQQALAFARVQASRLVADGVVGHRQAHPAYGVLRGFSAWHVGPLAAGHRGVIAPVAIDGPLINEFAFSMSVRRAADSPLRYMVGGERTITLATTDSDDWTNPTPPG